MNLTIDLNDKEKDTYYLFKEGGIVLAKSNRDSLDYIFMYKNKCLYLNDDDHTLKYYIKKEEINRFFITFLTDTCDIINFNCAEKVKEIKNKIIKNYGFTYYYIDDDNIIGNNFKKCKLIDFLKFIFIIFLY